MTPRNSPSRSESRKGEEERNAKRAEHFKKTGKWVYDVKKIQ